MFRKFFLLVLLLTAFMGRTIACGWYDADDYFFNLFSQEIMNDPRYKPFLLTYDRYYTNEILRNGNIEEWQRYLGLSYEDTRYLVFESKREDLQSITKGKTASDPKLSFVTPEFAKKHKQALLYLAYSKYLEPYMRIIPGEDNNIDYWDFSDDYEHHAGDLDYNKVKTVLTKSWKAESDTELKLRYGYQLVRLAHYTRRFEEAVQLFDTYVEPLNLHTEMYYYALSQKAGALRGMGETEQANREFVRVFANSTDLKTQAYTSMTMGWDNEISFADFVAGAADDNERNEIYLLMGYSNFNNPVNEIEKIIANNPDAIQAKVLMVRAINMLERNLLTAYFTDDVETSDPRYPMISKDNEETLRPFLNQTMALSDKQCGKATEKNFWNLASSYLHFLNKDFDKASSALAKVNSKDELYMTMVRNLTAYIDICKQPNLTAEVENTLFGKYEDLITKGYDLYENQYVFNSVYPTFVERVLTNRYTLQEEFAKSFLVTQHLTEIENNPREELLDEIQSFLNKKDKTSLERYLAMRGTAEMVDFNRYIAYVKGVLRLSEGNLKAAKPLFDQQTRLKVSKRIFGHNIQVWYSGKERNIMRADYLDEFSFIHDNMNEAEVTDVLMRLQAIGEEKDGDRAAKAYYLMANFFYNVSVTGYYRHYLRFDNNNGFSYSKFSLDDDTYLNTLYLSEQYLEKAKKYAKDDELKAHIVFAQAKNAQQDLEREGNRYLKSVSDPLWNEFERYKQTDYYTTVYSNCVYYSDYRN
jgi:hypothetical protein